MGGGARYEDRFIDGELMPFDLVPGDEASPFLVKQMSPLIAQSVFQPAFAPRHLDSLPSMRQRRDVNPQLISNDRYDNGNQANYRHRKSYSEYNEPSGEQLAGHHWTSVAGDLPLGASVKNNHSSTADSKLPAQQNPNGDKIGGGGRRRSQPTKMENHTNLGAKIRAARMAEKKFLLESQRATAAAAYSTSALSTSKLDSQRNSRNRKSSGVASADDELLNVETNANSDQFDSINQQELAKTDRASRRRNLKRKKQNKGSCINWNRYYTECRAGDTNPFQGTISFDNVGMAWTTIFLVISLEGWSDIMYLLQDSHSFWVWTYFVLLIVIGSFFMINLCLVVIATQFSATKKREMERMRQERLRFSSSSTLTATSESTNCYTVIVKYIAHGLKRTKNMIVDRLKRRKCDRLHKRRLRDGARPNRSRQEVPDLDNDDGNNNNGGGGSGRRPMATSSTTDHGQSMRPSTTLRGTHHHQGGGNTSAVGHAESRRSSWRKSSRAWNTSEETIKAITSLDSGVSGAASDTREQVGPLLKRSVSMKRVLQLDHNDPRAGEFVVAATHHSQHQQQSSTRQRNEPVANQRQLGTRNGGGRSGPGGSAKKSSRSSRRVQQHPIDCPYCDGGEAIEINLCPRFIGKNKRLRRLGSEFNRRIKRLVDHRYFQRLILLAILINAISMGIEYHNQPRELTEAVEISNIVFACLFLIEMILKLIAHGLYDYVIDGFNCFDGCIVIISILELFASTSGGSGLSVLRTFRLLRILKLVRFMPALRRQLVIMLRTLDNVAVFFGLLVLFIFIFSILGMNLFGCKFCETLPDGTERCDRKNFNTLLWSLVTVFQILTQEDWNVSVQQQQ